MGGITMLEDLNKLLDVLENLLDKVDTTDPKEVNELAAFGERLEALSIDVKDRMESGK
jgi:CRISPR/Cas system CSM-associated protein Csm2 small subunit